MTMSVEWSIDVMTSAVKPGGRVDDDPVVVLTEDRVDLAQELGADRARLIRRRER